MLNRIVSVLLVFAVTSVSISDGNESQVSGQLDAEGPKCPSIVAVGEEHTVHMPEISNKGEGIARIADCIVFVQDGKVGDTARIEIDNVGNRFAEAHVITAATL